MTLDAGLHLISAADYHADPCERPSLSSHLAVELLTQSPAHARYAHPKLTPDHEREDDPKFDLGRACHGYLLEGDAGVVVVPADDWRTKQAREARDMARLAGKTPLLGEQYARVLRMATRARQQLAEHHDPPPPLTDGWPEATLIWCEDGVWCRARLDWLHHNYQVFDDYKTTKASANPADWTRGILFSTGCDVQEAFYARGVRKLFGVDPRGRFVVQEDYEPHALSVIGLGPDIRAFADRKVERAIDLWRACLKRNKWPGYPTRTWEAELPGWEEARWVERETREDAAE